jgi:hypothetical protein
MHGNGFGTTKPNRNGAVNVPKAQHDRLGVNIPKTHVIKSMTFGSRDLMKNPLVVRGATQQQIRIVLAGKPASTAPTLPSPAPRLPPVPPA